MSIGLIGSMVVLTGGSSVAAEEPVLCAPGYFSATGTAPCEPAPAGLFVKSSANYTSLSRWSRVLIDSIVRSACSYVGAITPTLTVQRTDLLVAKYNRLVNVLLVGGWLTPSQATTLKGMASGL